MAQFLAQLVPCTVKTKPACCWWITVISSSTFVLIYLSVFFWSFFFNLRLMTKSKGQVLPCETQRITFAHKEMVIGFYSIRQNTGSVLVQANFLFFCQHARTPYSRTFLKSIPSRFLKTTSNSSIYEILICVLGLYRKAISWFLYNCNVLFGSQFSWIQ